MYRKYKYTCIFFIEEYTSSNNKKNNKKQWLLDIK